MKLKELKGKTRDEQFRLIGALPQVDIGEILEKPDQMAGKIIIFRGNYDGFDTKGLCIRILEYLEKEEKWEVSDLDLSDMQGNSFDMHFDKHDMWRYFRPFCEKPGFLLEK